MAEQGEFDSTELEYFNGGAQVYDDAGAQAYDEGGVGDNGEYYDESGSSDPGAYDGQGGDESEYIEYEYNEGIAVTLYEYVAQDPSQLSYYEGDAIEIVERREGGWWLGSLNGEPGLFLVEYTDHADELNAPPAQEEAQPSAKEAEAVSGPSKKDLAMAELQRRKEELEVRKKKLTTLQDTVEMLTLRKESAELVVEDMLATRCSPAMLSDEIAKLVLELVQEDYNIVKLATTRQSLHDQLHSLAVLINRDVKKGNPLDPFKASLLDKLNAFATKLMQDTTSRAVYEKNFKPFLAALQELESSLETEK